MDLFRKPERRVPFVAGRTRTAILLLFLLLGGVVSCAPAPAENKIRFFWPPNPGAAKIEYIQFINTEEDIRSTRNPFKEAILGREIPTRIFRRPFDVSSDGHGKLYVTEPTNNVVVVVDFVAEEVSLLRDRSGNKQTLDFPFAVAATGAGPVFVADSRTAKIYRFSGEGLLEKVWKVDGLISPVGLAADEREGRLFIADSRGHQIVCTDFDGNLLTSFGERGRGATQFNYPLDVDLDEEGNLYVLDSLNARVKVFSPSWELIRQFGERGTSRGSFNLPKGIAVSSFGQVYVTDGRDNKVVVFDLQGSYLATIGSRFVMEGWDVAPGGFYLPAGVDTDRSGAIWIADSLNSLVHKFQYLTPDYLEEHPILPEQTVLPIRSGQPGPAAGGQ